MRARLTVRRRLSLDGDFSINFAFISLPGTQTLRRSLGTCTIKCRETFRKSPCRRGGQFENADWQWLGFPKLWNALPRNTIRNFLNALVQAMPHAKSLRAIGQSLEALGVVAFVMQKDGRNYLVRSDSLADLAAGAEKQDLSEKIWDRASLAKKTRELLKENGSVSFLPPYISWLDAQGRRKRRKRQSAQATGTMKLSQLLRTVGRHLDRLEPHAFTISWSATGATIHYELADGQQISETLSMAKVRELTLRMRFQRSRRR